MTMKTLFFIFALTSAVVAWADEPKPSVLDPEDLLNQTELNVLTRQYEKALTEFYDSKLQLQLVTTVESYDNVGKEEVKRRVEMIELRLKVLDQWRDDIRRRIVVLVAERNARERERQDKHRKANPTQEKKGSP
jgi:hypothetical protein